MRQTETYKLNLIDMDDTFSPEPINQNTQKLEAKLAALDGADAALDQRITVLEGHKLAVGTYTGSGSVGASQTIQLGFKPKIVILEERNSGNAFMALDGLPFYTDAIVITDNGFCVRNNSSVYTNSSGHSYVYLAIK